MTFSFAIIGKNVRTQERWNFVFKCKKGANYALRLKNKPEEYCWKKKSNQSKIELIPWKWMHRRLTLIRLGESERAPSWYILLYNISVTHPNFMKLHDFLLNLSGLYTLDFFFIKFELVFAVAALFTTTYFFLCVFCWENEYILDNIRRI